MDVRCDRCQTEYELDDDIVTDAGASVQCTTCGHTFFVRRHGRGGAAGSPSSPVASGRRAPEGAAASGLASARGLSEELAPASPEWTLDTEDGKVHRFRELNTLQKWIVERRVTPEDRVSHAGGPFRLLAEIPELVPFFAVVEEADRARIKGASTSSSGDRAGRGSAAPYRDRDQASPSAAAGSASPSSPGDRPTTGAGIAMEPTISFTVPVAEAFRRASEDGPTVPDRRLVDPGVAANGLLAESSAEVTAVSPPPTGTLQAPASTAAWTSASAHVPAARGEGSGAGPVPPPVPPDASRPHPRATGPVVVPGAPSRSTRPSTPHPGALGPTQTVPQARRAYPSGSLRQTAVTESVFPSDPLAEDADLGLLLPRRTGRGVAWIALVVVLGGASAGTWWWYYRSRGGPGAGLAAQAGPREASSTGSGSPGVLQEPASTASPAVGSVPSAPAASDSPASASPPTPSAQSAEPTSGPKAPAENGPSVAAPESVKETGSATATATGPLRGPTAGASGARSQARAAPPGPAAAPSADADHAAGSPADRAASSGGAEAAGEARPPTYERLVVEGNRLRARGNVARASKLYEQALAMRPDGVMALTGTGYVQLDHQRHFKAIDFFRRALAIDPTHGPALFGIAEAYRARGDSPEALAAYRQYLALAPTGADAPEARRQIKALSSDDESP